MTYSEGVPVALVIQRAKRMHHYCAAICSRSGSTTFSHIISNGTIFEKKKKVIE